MAIKFEKIQEGMTLYDVHSRRMGNTTMRTLGVWRVQVISVDPVCRQAMCSWNGNLPSKWSERNLKKLYAKEPVLVKTASGAYRRLRRGEVVK